MRLSDQPLGNTYDVLNLRLKHLQSVNRPIARRDSAQQYEGMLKVRNERSSCSHPQQPFPALHDIALGWLEMLSCLTSFHALSGASKPGYWLVKDAKRDGEDRQQQADGKASNLMS